MDSDLKQELAALNERLRCIEVRFAKMSAQMEAELDNRTRLFNEIHNIIKRHDQLAFGNGTDGVQIRLDRLEEKEKSRQRNLRAVWVILSGLAIKIIHDLFYPK